MKTLPREVVVATSNPGKLREIRAILAASPAGRELRLRSLDEFPPVALPEEGDDYAANAAMKARGVASALGLHALADDSGLEVEGLGGAPGPRSARYGGPGLDDAGRTARLLEASASLGASARAARFVCVAALAAPDGALWTARGECGGRLLRQARGRGGFGYDPIFEVGSSGRSMAELPEAEKNRISHRARALQALFAPIQPLQPPAPPQRMDLQARAERDERWRLWMVAAQAGDGVAYEKLLLELLPHLRRFVSRRIGDPGSREDVVQNVLVSLHRARHTFRPERSFGPWLYAVARNAVTDHLRARARRARREVSVEPEALPEPAQPPPAEDGALSPELERALAALPPAQREAVLLVQVEGLSVAEAAERAGVSKAALKVRAHRGYKAMRARLGGGA